MNGNDVALKLKAIIRTRPNSQDSLFGTALQQSESLYQNLPNTNQALTKIFLCL